MWMFLKLAYGNLIKNRRTSLTILLVVFICVFVMEFGVAFMDGFKQKILGDYLNDTGHINIYDSRFYKEMDFTMNEYNIELKPGLIDSLKNQPGVAAVKPEINFGAIANTQTKNLDCMVTAIDAESAAKKYAKLAASVIKGGFITKKDDILVGVRGAALLNVNVGDKLIILSVDQFGSVNAAEGTIAGIFKTFSAQKDERSVICALPLAQKLLGMDNRVTKITVNLNDPLSASGASAAIGKILPPGAVAVPWQTGQAFLVSYIKLLDVSGLFICFLIIFGASMGIINSFLMNIMHRLPEFGALRAMGLGKLQMFLMIIAESFILGVTGTVLAIIPGTALVLYVQAHPFNYERMFKTMQGTPLGGMDASMGTVLVPLSIGVVILTGILISVIASSYPAWIAISKKPSEIMRVLE
jgi:ABC-type lipoprotein release transport system permease subunit